MLGHIKTRIAPDWKCQGPTMSSPAKIANKTQRAPHIGSACKLLPILL